MAANRYGRIYHSDSNYINLRFPSTDARDAFAVKFEKYHEGHDHDGDPPRFEEIKAAEAASTMYESGRLHDATKVTIDGYASYEIEEYHEDNKHTYHYRYKPPTCCVSPLISIDRELVDSGTLDRHELSAIFGDMPDTDFQSLLASVQEDGFIDNVIRLYKGQILDGWHRYRAAQELNLIRKLRFTQWHEDAHRDGDPRVFVFGRNYHRRHDTAARRAQIVVAFNERFGLGNIKAQQDSGTPNGEPKTREELAKIARVGTRTIDRAIAIEKEGQSEAVRTGEKTAGEVLLEKQKKRKAKAIWDTRIEVARDYTGDADSDLNMHLTLPDLEDGFVANNPTYADHFEAAMDRTSLISLEAMLDDIFATEVDIDDLQAEYRAMLAYSGDIRQWQRPNWDPDTNWILPMIEKAKKLEATAEPEPDPEPAKSEAKVSTHPSGCEETSLPKPDLKTLREQVKSEISKYKEWYKESGYKAYELISHASFSHFIEAYRNYRYTKAEGAATAEELTDLLGILKRKSYPFSRHLRTIRGGDTESGASEGEKSEMSLNTRMEQCRAALTEVWRQTYTWEGLEVNVYAEKYGIRGDVFEIMQKEIAEAHRKPEVTSPTDAGCEIVEDLEADTSLTEIDNLPAVKHFLEMIDKQVGTFVHPIQKDNLSVAIYDIFTQAEGDEDEGLTERQQLALLIEMMRRIVAE